MLTLAGSSGSQYQYELKLNDLHSQIQMAQKERAELLHYIERTQKQIIANERNEKDYFNDAVLERLSVLNIRVLDQVQIDRVINDRVQTKNEDHRTGLDNALQPSSHSRFLHKKIKMKWHMIFYTSH